MKSTLGTVLFVLALAAACTSGAPSQAGHGRRVPYQLAATATGSDSAPDALRVDKPANGYKPKLNEERASEIATKPPSMPGDPSSVESFRLGRVSVPSGYSYSGADPGPFNGRETWVQLHLVPAGEHIPSAGGGCTPSDAYRWAVLVNAETGAVGVWTQGFAKGRC